MEKQYGQTFTMWNSRSPCGADSVAERRSLHYHYWTSWLALDKENHWQSTTAVALDEWVQWALHNPSVCCSQSPLDGAAQNDLGIESFQAVTHPTICGVKPCLTSMITWQALYPRPYSFSLYKSKLPVSQYKSLSSIPRPRPVWWLVSNIDMNFEISTIGPQ